MEKRINKELAKQINMEFKKAGLSFDVLTNKSLKIYFNSGITQSIQGYMKTLKRIGIKEKDILPIALQQFNRHLNGAEGYLYPSGFSELHTHGTPLARITKAIRNSTINKWAKAIEIIDQNK
uniref:Uncharacterized protein n=1 Tax=viral metagenome TaxID=1070528 RepID=A0A6M3JJ06_9ZZZZ